MRAAYSASPVTDELRRERVTEVDEVARELREVDGGRKNLFKADGPPRLGVAVVDRASVAEDRARGL